jgi:hypothetical protein
MKRSYIAAGPWRQVGQNVFLRIVAYKGHTNSLVCHFQEAELLPGDVSMRWGSGDYPATMERLLEIWAKRNADNMAAHDGVPAVFATPEQVALLDRIEATKYSD